MKKKDGGNDPTLKNFRMICLINLRLPRPKVNEQKTLDGYRPNELENATPLFPQKLCLMTSWFS